jgi:uncharacterized protein DUF2188
MAREVYTVVLLENQWKVRFQGKHNGPYASQDDAIAAAVESAHKAGKANPDGAQVRVQSIGNNFRTAWTSGVDPYPPQRSD